MTLCDTSKRHFHKLFLVNASRKDFTEKGLEVSLKCHERRKSRMHYHFTENEVKADVC